MLRPFLCKKTAIFAVEIVGAALRHSNKTQLNNCNYGTKKSNMGAGGNDVRDAGATRSNQKGSRPERVPHTTPLRARQGRV